MLREQGLIHHVRTINACNQRGGRMLSLVDLIDAHSMDVHLAAYLAVMMQQGASLIVGASPGGAGKTAVMCACLNFVPEDMVIQVMDGSTASELTSISEGKRCYLAHEIGAGSYYAYVWGQKARAFFDLQRVGYMIASNMHADTLNQMHDQLCVQNDIPRELVDAVTLKIFLLMQRTPQGKVHRWISHVYENDGVQDNLVWEGNGEGTFSRIFESRKSDQSREEMWRYFLTSCQKRQIRKIEDVRRILLGFLS